MISAKQMDGIRRVISEFDDKTAKVIENVIDTVGLGNVDALRTAMLDALEPLGRVSYENICVLAMSVYNAWRLADLGEAIGAKPYGEYDSRNLAIAVNTALSGDGPLTKNAVTSALAASEGKEHRKAYTSQIYRMAETDPKRPRLARVPSGTETCKFCIALASKGWWYVKGEDGGKAHTHANCDCVYVASWKKNPKAEGYDPDFYLDVYEHPERHDEFREARNARARELYAEKKAMEKAEEADE